MKMTARVVLTIAALALNAACGGDASAPTISNLVLGQRTLAIGQIGQGSFHLSDPDGDLGQAKAKLTFKHASGTELSTDIAVQQVAAGATAFDTALVYGLNAGAQTGAWTVSVSVTDDAGNASNTLSSTVTITP